MRRHKVYVQSPEGLIPFPPQRVFQVEGSITVVATDGSPLALMKEVIALMDGPFVLVYENQGEGEEIRCSSRAICLQDAVRFLEEHEDFLVSDPRHTMTASAQGGGNVTLDEHNFLVIREFSPKVQAMLASRGIHEGRLSYPTPHVHRIYPEFDEAEHAIIDHLTKL